MPKLIVKQKGKTREYELGAEPVMLGRSSSNTVPLPDERASRDHCKIECVDGTWYAVDLDSSNGTFVGDERITRAELADGSVVRIGDIHITFVDRPADQPPAPAVPPDMSLRAIAGPCDEQVFKIDKHVTQIGRNQKNDIVLDDSSVSGRHAELIIDGHDVRIVDKGSRNGITVNQARVQERGLDNGDQIGIGLVTLELAIGAVEGAAAAAEAPAEPKEAEPAKTGLAAMLTTRAKVLLALAAAAVILAGLLYNPIRTLLTAPDRRPRRHPGNLLTESENPSFEKRDTPGIPGWYAALGSASQDETDVKDGWLALYLASPADGAGGISALCWSSEVAVSPAKRYEFSALVKNSAKGSAALCAKWLSRRHPWLRSVQFGGQTADALAWRRVSQKLDPPSWATGIQVGCAVVGQGAARFDGLVLREVGEVQRPPRVSAGRVEFEADARGEFAVFADRRLLFGRGRAVVVRQGGPADQSAATIEKDKSTASPTRIRVTGKLGLDAKIPFDETISSDGAKITLEYGVTLSDTPGSLFRIEMVSGQRLRDRPITLETIGGAYVEETAPFPNKADITRITFFTGERRVFLKLGRPANVSATEGADDSAVWRFEFPSSVGADRFTVSLVWESTNRAKNEGIRRAMTRATEAEQKKELGKAAQMYRDFIRGHPLYARERAEASRRLGAVRARIRSEVSKVEKRAETARVSERDEDFAKAELACRALLKKLDGDDSAKELGKTLGVIGRERAAAVKKRRESAAASFVAKARRHIARKSFHQARWFVDHVAKHYAETTHAKSVSEVRKALAEAERQATEQEAAKLVSKAKQRIEEKLPDSARWYLNFVVKNYPGTGQAGEARELLGKLPRPK